MSNVFVVVTPVFQETMAQIEKNHLSVVNQVFDYPATVKHLLVFDGPQATLAEHLADALSIRLPVNANDSGATPRAVGAAIGWTIPNASTSLSGPLQCAGASVGAAQPSGRLDRQSSR